MTDRVTCVDVAKMVGVAPSTVSRVINGSASVSTATRSRVLKAVKLTGYRPSQAASSLPRRHHNTIGLVAEHHLHGAHVPDFIRGVSVELTRTGQHLAINMVPANHSVDILDSLPLIRSVTVDGMILDICNMIGDVDHVTSRLSLPIVFVNAPSPRPVNTVMPDDSAVASHAVEYLLQQGHKKIAYVPGCATSHSSIRLRMSGYSQTMMDAGLQPMATWNQTIVDNDESYLERIRILRDLGATALIEYNSNGASYVLRACFHLGIRVPQDLSIVVCDHDILAEHAVVPFTGFRLDRAEMGRLAVGMLRDRIEKKRGDVPSIFLKGELVEGKSVHALS